MEPTEQEKLMLQSYAMAEARHDAEEMAIQQYARSNDPERMLRERIYDLIACTANSVIDCAPREPQETHPDSLAWHRDNATRTERRISSDLLFHRLVQAQAHLICEEVFRYQRGMAGNLRAARSVVTDTCALCGSTDDVRLCIWEYVIGSAGVIRPVCAKCRGDEAKEKTEP